MASLWQQYISERMEVMRKQTSWITGWRVSRVDRTANTKAQLAVHVMLEELQRGRVAEENIEVIGPDVCMVT